MYSKIYFNDKPLFLCDQLDQEIESYSRKDDTIFIDEFSASAVDAVIHDMRSEKVHAGIFVHSDLEELRTAFRKKFTIIKAGGGLVQNESGKMLFMLRRNKWDLPKGKLDEGESIEQCAVREVEEETGLKKILLGSPLLITYHTYEESGRHLLKETHWFHMTAPGDQAIVPQLEEQITEIKWVGEQELTAFTDNTYPSILDVLRAAGFRLQ